MLLECCDGGELFEYMESKRMLPEDEAILILRQLLNGIIHMHEKDYVHRDLKLENILFKNAPRKADFRDLDELDIRIIDFGLARDMNKQDDNPDVLTGTTEYMAPEIVLKIGHG